MWQLLQCLGTWDWRLINSFASWFSALGTFAAVIVALYLASRERRPRLKVVAGIRILLAEGLFGGVQSSSLPQTGYFNISVTNIGYRDAQINGLLWSLKPFKCGQAKKRWLVLIPPQNTLSSELPTTLKYGEVANYYLTLAEYEAANADTPMYVGYFPRLAARFTRIVVRTSTGNLCSSMIERELGDYLLNAELYRKPE